MGDPPWTYQDRGKQGKGWSDFKILPVSTTRQISDSLQIVVYPIPRDKVPLNQSRKVSHPFASGRSPGTSWQPERTGRYPFWKPLHFMGSVRVLAEIVSDVHEDVYKYQQDKGNRTKIRGDFPSLTIVLNVYLFSTWRSKKRKWIWHDIQFGNIWKNYFTVKRLNKFISAL